MLIASFNGFDLMLIVAALMGATLVMYSVRRHADTEEKPEVTVRDHDPLEEAFRGEAAFKLWTPADEEG